MNRHVITALKLLIVAALLVFVFYNVQWIDKIRHVAADGSVTSEAAGRIIGPWDGDEVAFRAEGSESEQMFQTGADAAGARVEALPGFLTYMLRIDVLLALCGAAGYFISVAFAAARWWWLLRVNELQVTWFEAFRFTWIGIFFNNIVPGQTGGDVAKAVYIMKHCHGGRVPALVSVLVDRVMGLGSLALLAAVVVLFALDDFGELALGIWGVLAGVGLIGVVAFSKRIRRFVRLDDLLKRLPAALSGPLQRIDQAIYFYRRHKTGILVWMLLGIVNHVISVSSVLLFGYALRIAVPAFDYYVLIPVINIISALPLGPNGWGVGEAAFRYLFAEYCGKYLEGIVSNPAYVMGTRGFALSVLYRIHLSLWSLLGGLLMLVEKERVTREDLAEAEPVG